MLRQAPADLRDPEDLQRLPLIDRSTLRDHLDEMCTVAPTASHVDYTATGGTGGEPLAFYIDAGVDLAVGEAPVDRLADPSWLHVLLRHHPKAIAVSAATGDGIDALQEAVIEALSADFVDAEIRTGAGNGRVLGITGAAANRNELRIARDRSF